jgi:phytoene dehydrogenase-like protein
VALFGRSKKEQAQSGTSADLAPNTYDFVFMGTGHNGLVAAAYLAKAGKKVLLLESREYFGGGVITRELTLPGFHHDQHSTAHNLLLANPMIAQDELGLLSRFGLKYLYPEVPHATVFPDNTSICTYRDLEKTIASIATVSQRDADAYRRFAEKSLKVLPMAIGGAFVPPVPMGQMVAMLDQSEEGREFFQTMQRSPYELADQWFETDKVKLHLLRLIAENLQIPDELGTGTGFLLWPALIHTYGIGQPVGGSGKLAESLVRCIEAYGGTILLSRAVEKVLTSDGRATGLRTVDGEEFHAREAVVAAIHPHKLDKFVDGIPPRVIERAKAVTTAALTPLTLSLALKEIPRSRAGADPTRAVMSIIVKSDKLSDIMDDFADVRRGRIPERLLLICGCSNVLDKTRAPEGAAVMFAGAHASYELADGRDWDDFKEEFADRVFEALMPHFENLTTDMVLGRHVDSPLDHERHSPNSFVRGDIHGAAPYFYQSQAHRPTPDLGDYTVPGVERLYLVGPFMHPGGGVMGGGRGTAIKICSDLGIDFERDVAKEVA